MYIVYVHIYICIESVHVCVYTHAYVQGLRDWILGLLELQGYVTTLYADTDMSIPWS